MATVVLLGTLDTKGAEYGFLRDRLGEHEVDTILVDVGILGGPNVEPDVSREEAARAAGEDIGELARSGDRGAAVAATARGAGEIVERLHAQGRLDGGHGTRWVGGLFPGHPGDAWATGRCALRELPDFRELPPGQLPGLARQ
jgi:uncharacterized protein (UPF0261 family)